MDAKLQQRFDECFAEWSKLREKGLTQTAEAFALADEGTAIFKQMVHIEKDDPSRPKNGDARQNGARL